jgi:hypothetical protein
MPKRLRASRKPKQSPPPKRLTTVRVEHGISAIQRAEYLDQAQAARKKKR